MFQPPERELAAEPQRLQVRGRDTGVLAGQDRLAEGPIAACFSAKGNGPAAISYRLVEPAQGSVGVIVTSGSTVLCANFGGTVSKDSGTNPPNTGGKGVFTARNAAAPGACPVPPDTCP